MRKDIKILIGLTDRPFLNRAMQALRRFYTVSCAWDLKTFAEKVHTFEPNLIIIDYQFSGLKASDLYQGVELLHPDAVFVVRARKERLRLARLLWKRRAMDYIRKSSQIFDFVEDVHKVVRYIVERKERMALNRQIADLKNTIAKLRKERRKGR